MKISTKGRYALRLMLDLAIHNTGEPVRIKDIAARQEISDKYLEQIISSLNKAGYVKSIRGPQGGYRLTSAPGDYTVLSILEVTEGPLAPVACMDQTPNACARCASCLTLPVWQGLDRVMRDYLGSITLSSILERAKDCPEA